MVPSATQSPVATILPPILHINLQKAGLGRLTISQEKVTDASSAVSLSALLQIVRDTIKLSPYESRRLVNEYLSFLELKVIYNDWEAKKLAPSDKIKTLWQHHASNKERYTAECKSLASHVIQFDAEEANKATQKSRYRLTLTAYKEVFRRDPPADIWSVETASEIS